MLVLKVAALLLALGLPGWALLFLADGGRARGGERAWLSLVTGTGLASLEALLLGYVSGFSRSSFLVILCLSGAALVLAAAFRRRKGDKGVGDEGAGTRRPGKGLASAVVLVVLGLALFAPPWRIVSGFSDVGIYPAMAANLVREGRWWVENRTAAELPPEHLDLVYHAVETNFGETIYHENQFYAFEDVTTGKEWPLFFHLWPSLLAVFAVFLGLENMFWALTWAAVLVLCGLFLHARRLLGGRWAWAAVTLAAVCPPLLYFGRYGGSEMMNALLFLGGALCAREYLAAKDACIRDHDGSASGKRGRGYGMAALSGFLFSLGFLCRIDFLFLLVPLVLFLVLRGAMKGIGGPDWVFLATTSLGAVFAVVAGNMYAHVYFNKIWRSFSGRSGWLAVAGGAALLLLLLATTRLPSRVRSRARRMLERRHWVPLLWAALAALFVWLYFIRPGQPDNMVSYGFIKSVQGPSYRSQDFLRWAWYLSPLGLVAIFAGYALCLSRGGRDGDLFLALCGLSFTVFYAVDMRALPQHILIMRRLVPVILPVGLLMSALILKALSDAGDRLLRMSGDLRRWGKFAGAWILRAAVAGIFLYLVAYMANASLPLWGVNEGGNQWEAVEEVAERVPEGAVLLMDYHSGDHFGTPLRCFYVVENAWLKEETMFNPERLSLLLDDLGFPDREVYLLWRPSISGERILLPREVTATEVLSFPVREYALEKSFEHRPRERRNPLEIYRFFKLVDGGHSPWTGCSRPASGFTGSLHPLTVGLLPLSFPVRAGWPPRPRLPSVPFSL